ncbi:MAG: Na+/H+ antiporter subunit E [Schaalia hyovaginalis]|uniref:Na+/H+ antiporter subunit E n=1 Tax=Schaalia hyovaginalis TaxID=29316 RepID=UPI002A91C42A|nr:Na+/H+ antiporter subunit E [Schaalia hyovaginalis]MDY5601455.1 Na+/H+ antiporter subunit E [Schaalia hyovaginalis]
MSTQSPSARAIARATKRPGRFPHSSMGMLVWLTLVWVMLWGEFSTSRVVWGFLLALLVTTVTPFPATPFDGRFRPLGVLILAIRLVADVLVSSFQQAGFILSGKHPKGAIIRVHLRSHSDAYLAIISTLTAIVPGSVVVEAHRASGTVYVHVFDERLAGGPDGVHRTILTLEERVMRAFASHEELVDAGYVPGSTRRAGRLPVPYAPPSGEEADGPGRASPAEGGPADGLECLSPAEGGPVDEGNADGGPDGIARPSGGGAA